MSVKKISIRPVCGGDQLNSIHPMLDKVYRARGITTPQEIEHDLKNLIPFHSLLNIDKAVERLLQALKLQEKVLVIGDFDSDGATSTAIAVRGLKKLSFLEVEYLVPNRFEYGYGLTPEIVHLASQRKPNLIITVDNGINSIEGVQTARAHGIDVIITDHHLAGEVLPDAVAIVNPNQPHDPFPSKNLAGCGVIFYVLLALRSKLRELNWFTEKGLLEPNLAELLDLVALGTVADVVPLDQNNRILVRYGVAHIRQGKCVPGIKALLEIGKKSLTSLVASDLGFTVAPRLNAAGRLKDMSLGINCLLSDDTITAWKYAAELDRLNRERRDIEDEMKQQAFSDLKKIQLAPQEKQSAISLFDSTWHQGVIGILAARVKDHLHLPTVVFARGDVGELKGSARSIPGYHIRDAFARIAVKYPDLLIRFGGHAMAAGVAIHEKNFALFKQALNEDALRELTSEDLQRQIWCDGELKIEDFNLNLASLLREAGPWGHHFPEPSFCNRFRLVDQRLLAEKHLRCTFAIKDTILEGVYFFVDLDKWPNQRCQYVNAVYKLDVNEYRGVKNLQLIIEHLEEAL